MKVLFRQRLLRDKPIVVDLISVHRAHAHVRLPGQQTLTIVPLTRLYRGDAVLEPVLRAAWERKLTSTLREIWARMTCLRPDRPVAPEYPPLRDCERALLPVEVPCRS